MPSIMITGASSGIGHACVAAAVTRGWHVFATIRRASDATQLTQTFGAAVTPIIMDVCDDASIAQAAHTVAQQLGDTTLAGLVNNAGVAVAGPSMHIPMAEFRAQFDINFFG
ncbi:MAG: SDR family NAD(P)-dependent oxidoreductase, partial [Roseiflexaceae bacterium]